MSGLKVYLLGTFHVVYEGEPITDFRTDKARALLAYLAVEQERPHYRESLATLLWPEMPLQDARRNLRVTLHRLRETLKDQGSTSRLFNLSRDTVQCRPDAFWVDALTFERLYRTVQHHSHADLLTCSECLHRLTQAVHLYQGDFLAQFVLSDTLAFTEWVIIHRERWHRMALNALYYLTEYWRRQAQWDTAEEYARRQIALEPWREEAHYQLIDILARKGEISAALVQYETCCRILAQELNVKPSHTLQTLYQRIQRIRHRSRQTLPPYPTPFVGREEEIQRLTEVLRDATCRLVCLIGPPGIGKTRLALEAARRQLPYFLHGVHFVPLEQQRTVDEMAQAIANTLNLSTRSVSSLPEWLIQHLSDWEALLVLDDLTPLLAVHHDDVVRFLTALLERAPGLKVLTTSHERPRTRWAWVLPVSSLAWPQPSDRAPREDHAPPSGEEDLLTYPAIRLFWTRARQVRPNFSLTQEATHVARICELVAGYPLGIELAAAWVYHQSCEEIARHLQAHLQHLTTTYHDVPARHRSLYAAFEHAWHFLSTEEQRICRLLAVFPGTFSTEAAMHVARASRHHLNVLVNKSLLRPHANGRFTMHALWRKFTYHKLSQQPSEAQEAHERHAQYYGTLLQRCAHAPHSFLTTPVRDELDNIRAAWQWAVQHYRWKWIDDALEGLFYLYEVNGWFYQGEQLLAQAIDYLSTNLPSHLLSLKGRLLLRLGWFRYRLSQFEQSAHTIQVGLSLLPPKARLEHAFGLGALGLVHHNRGWFEEAYACYERSLTLYQELDNTQGILRGLARLGLISYTMGRFGKAHTCFREALHLARQLQDRRSQAFVQAYLGLLHCDMGHLERAQQYCEDAHALIQEIQDPYGLALVLSYLGRVLGRRGEAAKAHQVLHKARALFHDLGDHQGEAYALTQLAEIALHAHDYPAARRWYEASYQLYRRIGNIAGAAEALGVLACIALLQHHTEEAHRLWGESVSLLQTLTAPTRDILIERWQRTFQRDPVEAMAFSHLWACTHL